MNTFADGGSWVSARVLSATRATTSTIEDTIRIESCFPDDDSHGIQFEAKGKWTENVFLE